MTSAPSCTRPAHCVWWPSARPWNNRQHRNNYVLCGNGVPTVSSDNCSCVVGRQLGLATLFVSRRQNLAWRGGGGGCKCAVIRGDCDRGGGGVRQTRSAPNAAQPSRRASSCLSSAVTSLTIQVPASVAPSHPSADCTAPTRWGCVLYDCHSMQPSRRLATLTDWLFSRKHSVLC
jgi:hypothetical protein